MTDFSEFDDYCDEQEAAGTAATVPEMFGQWLANKSGNAIIGSPIDGPPDFVAIPEEP